MVLRSSLLISSAIVLTACANNTIWYNPSPDLMRHEDMNYYKYDCKHAAESKAFLEYQLRNISPSDLSNKNRPIIQSMLIQMKDDCGEEPKPKPMSCVHVREDLPSGSAVATICNAEQSVTPLQRPTINHWDPLVDKK